MNPVLDFALLDEDATAGYLLKHASAVSQDTRLIASSFSATLGLLYLERQAPRIGGEASTMSSQALTALDQRLCTDFDASLDELDPAMVLRVVAALPTRSRWAGIARARDEVAAQFARVRGPHTGRARYIQSLLSGPSADVSPQLPPPLDPVAILQWTSPQLIAYAYELMAQPHRLDPDLADCLALIALSDLRKYRFDTACTLLCALLCCGCRSAYLDDGMAFIRLQRRSNGSYGHVNMLNKKNVIPDDLDRQFHLPFTVHALAVQDAGLRSLPSGGAA
ncbi:hypothetical protein [Stenotrophomonas sp. JAI102]|jgi:hypothetical protein|uniref:hypothetical protein n=1 Tax=Stenotrophomonas sp. JAI102 TaxID=2723077 RepID=UPI0015C6A204|nr:hypothetical protein [Stenotrophomonas sp. JAI102]NYF35685.1 hypothetical protein [Stenotrophomonas sp. JAI102]